MYAYKNVKYRERRDMFRKIYSGYKKYEPSMPVCVLVNTLADKICDNLILFFYDTNNNIC